MGENKIVILTGGGSAGHITPNLALAGPLREAGCDVRYMGQTIDMEYRLATGAGLPFYNVSAARFHRYFTLENLACPFVNFWGLLQALHHLRKIKPAVVFAKGGFVSVPVAIAARLRRIPVVLHECDFTPGLANKLCSPFAKVVCTNFEETTACFPEGKAHYTGTPLRAELLNGSREAGLRFCGFTPDLPVVLVMGGSQGAGAINDAVRAMLPLCKDKLQIMHLCGRGFLDPALEGTPGYKQLEYVSAELPDLYAMADVMVSRAGANALAEILLLAVPAILIPLPTSSGSRGDQVLNAGSFDKKGYSLLFEQEDMTPETLLAKIYEMLEKREDYIACMKESDAKNGTEAVMKIIIDNMKD